MTTYSLAGALETQLGRPPVPCVQVNLHPEAEHMGAVSSAGSKPSGHVYGQVSEFGVMVVQL